MLFILESIEFVVGTLHCYKREEQKRKETEVVHKWEDILIGGSVAFTYLSLYNIK